LIGSETEIFGLLTDVAVIVTVVAVAKFDGAVYVIDATVS